MAMSNALSFFFPYLFPVFILPLLLCWYSTGRTAISVPPVDQRVIKGTTATLSCNATHDPRVIIRYPAVSLSTYILSCCCLSWTRQCLRMYKVWNASLLQLSVGSGWQARPQDQRRPRLCASGLPDHRSDVVWGHWGLHLHCDVSGWQRLSHCTPRSYVSS